MLGRGGVHLPAIYMHCSRSRKKTDLVCSISRGGPSAFGIYMYSLCTGISLDFLLVECFEWALIGDIEKHRVHSVLWQFRMGGPSAFGIHMFSLCTGISLYFLIS